MVFRLFSAQTFRTSVTKLLHTSGSISALISAPLSPSHPVPAPAPPTPRKSYRKGRRDVFLAVQNVREFYLEIPPRRGQEKVLPDGSSTQRSFSTATRAPRTRRTGDTDFCVVHGTTTTQGVDLFRQKNYIFPLMYIFTI